MEINFQHIAKAEQGKINAALCLIVTVKGLAPRKAGSKMLVFSNGTTQGTVGGGNVEYETIETAKRILVEKSEPKLLTFNLKDNLGMICGGEVTIYIEPIARPLPLFIFGAGHVGKAVARYAPDFGFEVHLIDMRPEMFKEVDSAKTACLIGDYKDIIPTLPNDDNSYFIITTPRHEYDEEVLAAVARLPHKYVGMMASPIKVAQVKESFLKAGILTQEQLESIDMPVGIPIANETPEEIAISILAKLIDTKNKKI